VHLPRMVASPPIFSPATSLRHQRPRSGASGTTCGRALPSTPVLAQPPMGGRARRASGRGVSAPVGEQEATAVVRAYIGERVWRLELPAPHCRVEGVRVLHSRRNLRWGRADDPYTPAFWRAQVWFDALNNPRPVYALGRTLAEEVALCLLGGHGIRAEVALATFARLRERGLLDPARAAGLGASATAQVLFDTLREPVLVDGRAIRYRFAPQRSRYLTAALLALADEQPPTRDAAAFRAWMVRLPGVGWKTASWITRNYLGSDEVAILDIHILRAGWILGLFDPLAAVSRAYHALEARFLAFARGIGVSPSALDAVIWREMRLAGSSALRDVARVLMAATR
jgi:N-glycosylase/DNA lyase